MSANKMSVTFETDETTQLAWKEATALTKKLFREAKRVQKIRPGFYAAIAFERNKKVSFVESNITYAWDEIVGNLLAGLKPIALASLGKQFLIKGLVPAPKKRQKELLTKWMAFVKRRDRTTPASEWQSYKPHSQTAKEDVPHVKVTLIGRQPKRIKALPVSVTLMKAE